MSPLLDLLVAQPGLLADHALAYADLATQEATGFSRVWKRRILLTASALCCATVACALAGVSFMLWFVSPLAHEGFPWPLVITPLVPLLAFSWCMVQLHAVASEPSFGKIRQQWMADRVLLREMKMP
jgi:hypothetical protein